MCHAYVWRSHIQTWSAGQWQAIDLDAAAAAKLRLKRLSCAGKSHRELLEMEEGIQAQLNSGDATDPEFLGSVLRRLTLYKAKARLREFHEALLQKHVQRLRFAQEQELDVAAEMGWDREKVCTLGSCLQVMMIVCCTELETILMKKLSFAASKCMS